MHLSAALPKSAKHQPYTLITHTKAEKRLHYSHTHNDQTQTHNTQTQSSEP